MSRSRSQTGSRSVMRGPGSSWGYASRRRACRGTRSAARRGRGSVWQSSVMSFLGMFGLRKKPAPGRARRSKTPRVDSVAPRRGEYSTHVLASCQRLLPTGAQISVRGREVVGDSRRTRPRTGRGWRRSDAPERVYSSTHLPTTTPISVQWPLISIIGSGQAGLRALR